MVAVLALAALAAVAAPAMASVPAANTKFCNAANQIGSTGSSNPTQSEAKAAASRFKAAAKYAPPKVKSAINKIASVLGSIASLKDPTELAKIYTSSKFRDYSKAIVTYVTYYGSQCSGLGTTTTAG
jgi:hypothetical protein